MAIAKPFTALISPDRETNLRVLGIETSCDETGVAIYDTESGLLGHELYSQVDLHAVYGGVVPELASRDHVRRLAPMVKKIMADHGLGGDDIDGVAYTAGPGLMGALLVGACFARSLAFGWGVPAVAVHHMEGHLLAPLLEETPPEWPFLALLVSGGHSLLVDVENLGEYTILGTTLDDAAGEAFDKGAKLLGLGYPGGPAISRLAEQGNPAAFAFPRPLSKKPGLDFSFSGLKTALVIEVERQRESGEISPDMLADLAASYQQAIVDSLCIKCVRALKETGRKRLIIAGGVGANRLLREQLAGALDELGGEVYYPRLEFCTDNGAMIALAGAMRLASASKDLSISARARWPLDELAPISA